MGLDCFLAIHTLVAVSLWIFQRISVPTVASIIFRPKSLLAFVFALSLLAYFGGISVGNKQLENAAFPFVVLFGAFFVAFLILSLIRNIGSLLR